MTSRDDNNRREPSQQESVVPMLHAYRLVYPISEHAPPQIWEYEQPYIDNLLRNARTFERWVVQWYFEDWEALNNDNTRIWNTYYRPKPLYAHLPTWQDWLPEYRQLIIEVQELAEEHIACRTWTKPPGKTYTRSREELNACR